MASDYQGYEPPVRQRSEIPTYSLAAPSPQAPRTPRWKRPRNIIAAAALIAAAGIGTGIAITNSGPGTITIHGTLTLGPTSAIDSANPTVPANGDPCSTSGGYSDIAPGATVTIGGSSGQTLTVTALGAGIEAGVTPDAGTPIGECVFSFTASVPAGQSAYTVTISHRGTTTFTPAQAQAGMALTLGN